MLRKTLSSSNPRKDQSHTLRNTFKCVMGSAPKYISKPFQFPSWKILVSNCKMVVFILEPDIFAHVQYKRGGPLLPKSFWFLHQNPVGCETRTGDVMGVITLAWQYQVIFTTAIQIDRYWHIRYFQASSLLLNS